MWGENEHLADYARDGLASADGYLETLQERCGCSASEECRVRQARRKIREAYALLRPES